jgi:hypothetical protein
VEALNDGGTGMLFPFEVERIGILKNRVERQ